MSRRRTRNAVDGQSGERNWPRLFSVSLLVGSVLLALLIGAVLHIDAPDAQGVRPDESAGELPTGLIERVTSDRDRLADRPDDWTAQVAFLCDRSSAEQMLRRYGDLAAFYVISADHDGRLCYRICWNNYASLAAARSADDLPVALRGDTPTPKRVGEILR